MMIYELHFCKICLTTGAHNFRQSTYCIMRLKGMCFAKNVGSTFKERTVRIEQCVLYCTVDQGEVLVWLSHRVSVLILLA